MFENTTSFFYHLDLECFHWFNQTIHNWVMDMFMPLISNAGNAGLIWVLLGLALIALGKPEMKKAGFLMLVAVGFSYLISESIKHILQRPRPFLAITDVNLMIWPPGTYSFPSGHATCAFAAWYVLARKHFSLAWLITLLALAMAVSRVYVGVHYPVDVLAGALLGMAGAAMVLKFENTVLLAAGKIKTPFTRYM